MDNNTPLIIPIDARRNLMIQEIEFVRFLNRTGQCDNLRAAAGMRVLTLRNELQKLDQTNPIES